jgi:hypothetical protein
MVAGGRTKEVAAVQAKVGAPPLYMAVPCVRSTVRAADSANRFIAQRFCAVSNASPRLLANPGRACERGATGARPSGGSSASAQLQQNSTIQPCGRWWWWCCAARACWRWKLRRVRSQR